MDKFRLHRDNRRKKVVVKMPKIKSFEALKDELVRKGLEKPKPKPNE